MVMASRGFAEEILEEADLAVRRNDEHHQRTRLGQGDVTTPLSILAARRPGARRLMSQAVRSLHDHETC